MIDKISLIIPTIDSETYINKTIERTMYIMDVLIDTTQVTDYEIIIVLQKKDNETIDKLYKTIFKTIKGLCDYHKKRIMILYIGDEKGKGIAIHEGIKHSKYEWVVFMDDDMDYRPTWIITTITDNKEHIENGTKLIISTRQIYDRSIKRKILSKLYNLLVKMMFPSLIKIKDYQSGIKLINKESYLNIFWYDLRYYEKRYFWDTILIHKFKKDKLDIKEQRIIYKGKSEHGRSVKNMTKQMIKDMIMYRINDVI